MIAVVLFEISVALVAMLVVFVLIALVLLLISVAFVAMLVVFALIAVVFAAMSALSSKADRLTVVEAPFSISI